MDTKDFRGSGAGLIDADREESYWRERWRSRPYFRDDDSYDDYGPAYRVGWEAWGRYGEGGRSFDDIESDLRRDWETRRGSSRLGWDRARLAMRDAWERVRQGFGVAGSHPTGGGGSASSGSGSSSGSTGSTAGAMGSGSDPCDAGCATSDLAGSAIGASDVGSVGGGGIGALGGSGIGGSPGGTGQIGATSVGGDTFRSGDGFNYGYSGTSPMASGGGAGSDLAGGREAGEHRSLRYLNSFLRGEISACETYRQAIMRIGGQYPQLAECLTSHERRVATLKDRIRSLGGQPATGSGLWGAWAKLVQGTAGLFGERSAINALESGEDHGRDDYRRELDNLDGDTRRWVERELLMEEERTHAILSELKHAHV